MECTNNSPDSHSPLNEPHSGSQGPTTANAAHHAQLQVPEDVSGPSSTRHNDPEQDIGTIIASLESQVDELCGLLGNFKFSFETKLQAFHTYVHNLPDHVGVNYNGRQRAYLLGMYGKSIQESSELALHKLRRDLARLEAMASDDATQLYGAYANTESIISSLQPSTASSPAPLHSAPTIPEQTAESDDVLPSIVPPRSIAWSTPSPDSGQKSRVPGRKSMADGHHEAAGDFQRSKIPLRTRLRAWREARRQ